MTDLSAMPEPCSEHVCFIHVNDSNISEDTPYMTNATGSPHKKKKNASHSVCTLSFVLMYLLATCQRLQGEKNNVCLIRSTLPTNTSVSVVHRCSNLQVIPKIKSREGLRTAAAGLTCKHRMRTRLAYTITSVVITAHIPIIERFEFGAVSGIDNGHHICINMAADKISRPVSVCSGMR